MRDHVAPPNADTTARNNSAAKPASTRIDACPNCTTTPAPEAARDGTTLANTGVSTVAAEPASFTHRYADDAQTPNRSATTRGMSPVAFTSAISRSRASAVCRLRMPTSCLTTMSHRQSCQYPRRNRTPTVRSEGVAEIRLRNGLQTAQTGVGCRPRQHKRERGLLSERRKASAANSVETNREARAGARSVGTVA